jgi:flagellar biosynthesis protein FliQ
VAAWLAKPSLRKGRSRERDRHTGARQSIIVLIQVSGPLMLISLVVGLVISLFQALTQIQEQTLTFVPKIIILYIAMLVLLPFMLSSLITFTERLIDRIISIN